MQPQIGVAIVTSPGKQNPGRTISLAESADPDLVREVAERIVRGLEHSGLRGSRAAQRAVATRVMLRRLGIMG